jgi:ubiquinone/menaquinone biosynthesis C-methylase UbiE
VGCGTGALLESVSNQCQALFFGIDIQFDFASYAQPDLPTNTPVLFRRSSPPILQWDVRCRISHYFLLWVKDIDQVMQEINRIFRPGGFFAALAEPDYGSRIDIPEGFVQIGRMQRNP